MNAEKELLLALLIEKYTKPRILTEQPVKQKTVRTKRKRDYKTDHKWTMWEKRKLVALRDNQESWAEIAYQLGLREGQVKSAYSNLDIVELNQIREIVKAAS